MDFPLFQGASSKDIARFFGHFPVNFVTYPEGETVVGEGEPCSELLYVLSGAAMSTHRLRAVGIAVSETLGHGTVIGADNIFGLSQSHQATVTAVQRTGVMTFSKASFLEMMRRNQVYQFNYLNHLAATAQRLRTECGLITAQGVLGAVARAVAGVTGPMSENVTLDVSIPAMARALGQREAQVMRQLHDMVEHGLMAPRQEGGYALTSRKALVEAASATQA